MGGNLPSSATSCLLPIFWQLFSSPTCRGLIRQNQFGNLQHYFLQKTIIRAVATLRVQQVCPREVLSFLMELAKYNDNSRNSFSDSYYTSELIKAMKDTLTPAIIVRGSSSVSSLPWEARTVVEEAVRCLNMDTQMPSYKADISQILVYISELETFSRNKAR
ncbi:unnamed protein product [Protopolystoma xenopodis]|uniref:Transcription initiation factor TFIID subunit 2 TPR repeats domain-containing protein n=1 Tax=Protopolystoma xenopodis TaxID=117903 RepID=A0A448WPX7_9PLAT|nr:unnamed protein product [Protopolystoma xenopodis]